MTKPSVAAALAFLALAALALAVPAAQAHGAAPPREVDTRVLLDDDGGIGYGGCAGPAAESGVPCASDHGGLDLLVLDVREAWLGDEPAAVFRIVTQSEGDGSGALALSIGLAGAAREFKVADALAPAASSTFDFVAGPFDAFDGHPKAVDGWLKLSTLGAKPGDTLEGIVVRSLADGEPDDVMPGGWYANGQEVPHLPHDADPAEAAPAPRPGVYALKGPAPLLALEPAAGFVDLAASGNLTLRLANPLAGTSQDVTLSVVLPGGVLGGLDRGNLTLEPGATRQVTFRAAPGSLGGNATVVARSGLGGLATATVQVVVPASEVPFGDFGLEETSEPGKSSPAPVAAALALVLLAFAVVRRK